MSLDFTLTFEQLTINWSFSHEFAYSIKQLIDNDIVDNIIAVADVSMTKQSTKTQIYKLS